jgi:hypothetical protein
MAPSVLFEVKIIARHILHLQHIIRLYRQTSACNEVHINLCNTNLSEFF